MARVSLKAAAFSGPLLLVALPAEAHVGAAGVGVGLAFGMI